MEAEYLLTTYMEVRRMSRSYKHIPYCGDEKDRDMKRCANKKIRRIAKNEDYLWSAAEYKRLFCSWRICDYYWIELDFENYYQREVERWINHQNRYPNNKEPFPTREKIWQDYAKWYLRK